jgi:hypothetical protein
MTLFGRGALGLWVQLESDPSVVALCERPLIVPDTNPSRAVDFWARSDGVDRLIFSIDEAASAKSARREAQLTAFRVWAADVGCLVDERIGWRQSSVQSYRMDNWLMMLQYCASYSDSLGKDGGGWLSRVLHGPTTIAEFLQAAAREGICGDAELARAAIYDLVRCGRARIPRLDVTRLHDGLEVEPC